MVCSLLICSVIVLISGCCVFGACFFVWVGYVASWVLFRDLDVLHVIGD